MQSVSWSVSTPFDPVVSLSSLRPSIKMCSLLRCPLIVMRISSPPNFYTDSSAFLESISRFALSIPRGHQTPGHWGLFLATAKPHTSQLYSKCRAGMPKICIIWSSHCWLFTMVCVSLFISCCLLLISTLWFTCSFIVQMDAGRGGGGSTLCGSQDKKKTPPICLSRMYRKQKDYGLWTYWRKKNVSACSIITAFY